MSATRIRRAWLIASLAACALLFGAAPALGATFTVTNGSDSGAGSLRQAITDAETNANDPTIDQVQIDFTGDIDLESQLPSITTPMSIVGSGVSNVTIRRSPSAMTQFGLFLIAPAAGNTVAIQNLTISGARADNLTGGAILMDGLGNLILNSVLLSDNHALGVGGLGGAIFYDRGFTSIRNSTLSDNQADRGGAIRGGSNGTDNGVAELINVSVAGNSAADGGGGIDIRQEAGITLNSSTVVANVADSDDDSIGTGGGLRNNSTATDPFAVANTLLADNEVGTASPLPDQCWGDFTSGDYNLRATSEATCTGFDGTNDLIDPNPMLGPLMVNVLGPPTIALLPGSPAINKGNPATPGGAYPGCPATDERTLLRGARGNLCDIGAFEVQPNTSTTGVVCSPTSLTLGTGSTTCTATVTDDGSNSPATTPTGTLNFSSAGTGSFNPASCELTALTTSEASCEATFTPGVAGTRTVTGAYLGDADHGISQGSALVGVASPPVPPSPPAPAPTTTGKRAKALKKCKKKKLKGKKLKKCKKKAKKLPV
jgi:hypothetical protein